MSRPDALHADCIREHPDGDHSDPFVTEYRERVRDVVTALRDSDRSAHGVLVCDLALHLLFFIYDHPTPALRYTALEGVVYTGRSPGARAHPVAAASPAGSGVLRSSGRPGRRATRTWDQPARHNPQITNKWLPRAGR